MKLETQLTTTDKEEIFRFVDTRKFGDCIQDKYLIKFHHLLSNPWTGYAMRWPVIVDDAKGYAFAENYRTIIDILNPEKDVHVYFDHPIPISSIYFATFDKGMKASILKALEDMKANYRITPLGSTPMTVKVDMISFRDGKFNRENIGQSLKYIDDIAFIQHPRQLFDVIDTADMPKRIF